MLPFSSNSCILTRFGPILRAKYHTCWEPCFASVLPELCTLKQRSIPKRFYHPLLIPHDQIYMYWWDLPAALALAVLPCRWRRTRQIYRTITALVAHYVIFNKMLYLTIGLWLCRYTATLAHSVIIQSTVRGHGLLSTNHMRLNRS